MSSPGSKIGVDAPIWSFYKPGWFENVQEEYWACKERVGLMDMSSFTKVEVKVSHTHTHKHAHTHAWTPGLWSWSQTILAGVGTGDECDPGVRVGVGKH